MKNNNKKEQVALDKLIREITSNPYASHIPTSHWHRNNDYTDKINQKITSFIESMSIAGMKRFLSLKCWNNTPLSVWNSSSRKKAMSYISNYSASYMMTLKKGRSIAISHSNGSIACKVFDKATDQEKKKMAKRLSFIAKDSRLRKRIIPFMGIKRLNVLYMSEKNRDVIYTMEKVYSMLGISPPNKKCSNPVDIFCNMPMTEIDLQNTVSWNFVRKFNKISLSEDDVSRCLEKVSDINKTFDFKSMDASWTFNCLVAIVISIIPFMSKSDAISNLDIASDMLEKAPYNQSGNWASSNKKLIKNGYYNVMNSKWS